MCAYLEIYNTVVLDKWLFYKRAYKLFVVSFLHLQFNIIRQF